AFVYRNNARELASKNNYLKIKLKGPEKNTLGIGARITIGTNQEKQIKEQYLTRGFQSSISEILHFGVGSAENIKNLTVLWPDGKTQSLSDVSVNQQLILNYTDASVSDSPIKEMAKPVFYDATNRVQIDYKHVENKFDDFERE